MGRGRGGYSQIEAGYKDSAGHKVRDKNSIFVAERYIDLGYEVVFRREHQPDKSYDLTVKTSDDLNFVKNIEVKGITSRNPSVMAKRIGTAFEQFPPGKEDTVAIYLPNHRNNASGTAFARAGFDEAVRKGYVKGSVEIWFSDKTKITLS